MRAFMRYCHQEGFIVEAIHQKIKLLKTEEDNLQSFTPQEIKLLLNVIDDKKYVGFRDHLMIRVLLDTMVRISELLKINRANLDFKAGLIQLEAHETKTRKARNVPFSRDTGKLLKEFITETEEFRSEILFVNYDGSPMTAHHFRERLREYGEMAGIKNKRVSPHTFRHTGALFYILNGLLD